MQSSFKAEWTEDNLVGGHVVADFVNTAGGATKARDVERLENYESAIRWACAVKLITREEGAALGATAAGHPESAKVSLQSLRDFREALHGCVTAQQAGLQWPAPHRQAVEAAIKAAIAKANIVIDEQACRWDPGADTDDLKLIIRRLAISAEDFLRSSDLFASRSCERCSWIFVDRGRGRPRRWCSMATCGSRDKSARYYRKQRATQTE